MTRRLGVLILRKEDEQDLRMVTGLCRAAVRLGVEVEIFLMGEGVNYLQNQAFRALLNEKVGMSFCAVNAMDRSISRQPAYPWGLEEGTQLQLACLVEKADRFIALA